MTAQSHRAPRFEIRLSAELQVDGRTVTGTTRNLSIGGLCVEIDRPVKEGAMVRLSLFIVEDDVEAEGGSKLELMATVQWMAEGDNGYAIGLKLGNLNATQTAALTRALKAVGAPV